MSLICNLLKLPSSVRAELLEAYFAAVEGRACYLSDSDTDESVDWDEFIQY
jgi:hypothetical protein